MAQGGMWVLPRTPEGVWVVSEMKDTSGGRRHTYRHEVTIQQNERVLLEASGPWGPRRTDDS